MSTTISPDLYLGWKIKPTKMIFSVLNGSTPSSSEQSYWDGDIYWATPEDIGSLKDNVLIDTRRKITKEGYKNSGTQLAPIGSIVLTTRAPVGNLALAGVPLCTNQGCKTLVPKLEIINTRYFYYQFLARKDELGIMATGTTFQELGSNELRAFELWLPPFSEQCAIADYLDRATAKIDALIAAKQRLLNLLAEKRRALITHAVTRGLDANAPTRDSGVEWLGEIPNHWETPPVYTRYDVQLGKMLDEKRIRSTHLAPYLRNVDVQWGYVNTHNLQEMDFDEIDRIKYALRSGDILVCEGGEIGRTAIWHGELNDCYFQKAIIRLRPTTQKDMPEFFVYVMYMMVQMQIFSLQATNATIQHLPAETLRRMRYTAPPFSEQCAIVNYLNQKIGKLDALVAATSTTIELLYERRTALIAAAVTGKLKVTAPCN